MITIIGLEGYRDGWWKARRENNEVKKIFFIHEIGIKKITGRH